MVIMTSQKNFVFIKKIIMEKINKAMTEGFLVKTYFLQEIVIS